MTLRAGAEATRQVGELRRSVASVADEYGVAWDTVWSAISHHGRPLVDDPHRVGAVRALAINGAVQTFPPAIGADQQAILDAIASGRALAH